MAGEARLQHATPLLKGATPGSYGIKKWVWCSERVSKVPKGIGQSYMPRHIYFSSKLRIHKN